MGGPGTENNSGEACPWCILNLLLISCLLIICIGYTILDSVILVNGTAWLVTDDLAFPALGSITSPHLNDSQAPQDSQWKILTSEEAKKLGSYGALWVYLWFEFSTLINIALTRIRGVTWLSTDANPSTYVRCFSIFVSNILLSRQPHSAVALANLRQPRSVC